jgi:hypothetical protein
MSALVTDQFRILNASNLADSVANSSNSYYVFVGLSNPTTPSGGFGRSGTWDSNPPNPTDNYDYVNHYKSTILYGKKITSANLRRVVRRIDWTSGQQYDMYRADYSVENRSSSGALRLYDANYYVLNSDYRVYICLNNGSSGIKTSGNSSQIEPTFTDLEPTQLSDGYVWKFLYTVSPSDIVKFDSTEYIAIPNDWTTTTDSQITAVRENGDSTVNENQIKQIFIKSTGLGYPTQSGKVCNIVGDGSGGQVSIDIDVEGKVSNATVIAGGKNYTYALIDLGTTSTNIPASYANLIPIIPPSRGHGYDIYRELGADKVLVYVRFDDSTKDFPIDTKFAQVGIVKNPFVFSTTGTGTTIFSGNEFSAVYAMKFSGTPTGTVSIGDKIEQTVSGGKAYGYVVSYDTETKVLKYYRDRSIYYNGGSGSTNADFVGMSSFFGSTGTQLTFNSTNQISKSDGGFNATIDNGFSGITTTVGSKIVNLGVNFTNGLSDPEINSKSGDVLYIDNRPTVTRNSRQKEDVKIILEF